MSFNLIFLLHSRRIRPMAHCAPWPYSGALCTFVSVSRSLVSFWAPDFRVYYYGPYSYETRLVLPSFVPPPNNEGIMVGIICIFVGCTGY